MLLLIFFYLFCFDSMSFNLIFYLKTSIPSYNNLPERGHCTVKTPRDLGFFFFLVIIHTIKTRRIRFRKLAIAMILHGIVLIIRGAVNGLCICETKAHARAHTRASRLSHRFKALSLALCIRI